MTRPPSSVCRIKRSAQALALAEFAALDSDIWQRWQHPQMTASARRALILACVHAIDVHPASQHRLEPTASSPTGSPDTTLSPRPKPIR